MTDEEGEIFKTYDIGLTYFEEGHRAFRVSDPCETRVSSPIYDGVEFDIGHGTVKEIRHAESTWATTTLFFSTGRTTGVRLLEILLAE